MTRRAKKRARQAHIVVHDPRAPRLAAVATLVAGLSVILTAVNLVVDVVGASGFSIEEGIGLGVMLVMLVVANLANKERIIPELTHVQPHPDAEVFDTIVSTGHAGNTESVNPTTASILSSILGESQSTDQAQVDTAISTLSSGEFGAEVQRTMAAVEAANQTNIAPREAAPADEETGQTLERVLVQPVPLPGQEASTIVDPSTIPGLQPDRAFVTSGVASVPLPTTASEQMTPPPEPRIEHTPHPVSTAALSSETLTNLPAMPNLDELLSETTDTSSIEPSTESAGTMLPNLDDLFADLPEVQPSPPPTAMSAPEPTIDLDLPDLPDLDELF